MLRPISQSTYGPDSESTPEYAAITLSQRAEGISAELNTFTAPIIYP